MDRLFGSLPFREITEAMPDQNYCSGGVQTGQRSPGRRRCEATHGYAGLMYDSQTGKLRQAWVFVMTFS